MYFQPGSGVLRVLGWPRDDVPGDSPAAAAESGSLRHSGFMMQDIPFAFVVDSFIHPPLVRFLCQ